MEQNNYSNNISLCPRCQQKLISNTKYCKNCGYDMESSKTEAILSFGLKEAVIVTSDETSEISYSQKETKLIRNFKHLQNISLYILAILGILMFILPIFNYNNVWAFISKMQTSGYKFQIHDFLWFGSGSTIFRLFSNIFSYLSTDSKLLNVSLVMFVYEIIVLLIVLVIIGLSIWLLVMALLNSYNKKLYPRFYKGIVGIIMALSLVLVFTLNCLGVGPILLAIISFLCLVFFYVADTFSKERRFMLKHLIHKSLCFVFLFVLLVLSSYGLVNLNVDLGVNLYNFSPYPLSGDIDTPNTFVCQGLFLEFMMFIQCSSGDDVFTSVTLSLCILSSLTHIAYIFFIELAMVDLLRSLSKQNVKFPIGYIISSTVAFYALAIFIILFNQIVNEAMYQKFVDKIGQNIYLQFDQATIDQTRLYNRVFALMPGMTTSMLLSLPVCIYSIIAKSLCYKKTY